MKKLFLYSQALLYVLAGVNHFWQTNMYMAIMPPWLPWHAKLVYISGGCEVVFGLLLLPRFTRRLAVICIIVLLVAVFPANVQMAINYAHTHNKNLWAAIARLPLQVVLGWWAWYYYRHPAVYNKKVV